MLHDQNFLAVSVFISSCVVVVVFTIAIFMMYDICNLLSFFFFFFFNVNLSIVSTVRH